MTFCFVTLNLFQGLQFEGIGKHPLNAPPKKIKAKDEIASLHSQWRIVLPLRGCAFCSRGSLKVIEFSFFVTLLFSLARIFCHPKLVSGSSI